VRDAGRRPDAEHLHKQSQIVGNMSVAEQALKRQPKLEKAGVVYARTHTNRLRFRRCLTLSDEITGIEQPGGGVHDTEGRTGSARMNELYELSEVGLLW
jgi:hypothetical protein